MEKGSKNEQLRMAKALLESGSDPAFVAKISTLSLDEVKALQQGEDVI